MKNIFEKYNNAQERPFEVDLKKVDQWFKSSEIVKHEGLTLQVIAIGKKKSKYGDSGFIVGAPFGCKTVGINVPTWYIPTIESMLNDIEVVGAIRSGGVTVKIGKRTNTKNGNEYPTFEWDATPLPF